MSAIVQKRLRATLCFLFFVVLAMDIALLVLAGVNGYFLEINWRKWVALLFELELFIIYCYAVRGTQQVNKWTRAFCILIDIAYLLYIAGSALQVAISAGIEYFDCTDYYGNFIAACGLTHAWTISIIVVVSIAFVEVVYTLYNGPMNLVRDETKPEIITVSPAPYPNGIQPNMTIPHNAVQHQPLYQQPLYPNYPSPLPPTPQHQATFKYEDPVQPSYPQQPYAPQHQPYPLLHQTYPQQQQSYPQQQQPYPQQQQPYPQQQQPYPQEQQPYPQQQQQQPHPYSSGSYPQAGPTVTSVPQPGGAPAFNGHVSGISLASPVLPLADPSSPITTSPATPYATTLSDHPVEHSHSNSHYSPVPSIAAAVASPTVSDQDQHPSAAEDNVSLPHPQPPRNPQLR